MVVQRTINNLKERPKDERKVIATWIAIGIVIILLVGWALVSFARIRTNALNPNIQNSQDASTIPDTFESHVQTQ